MIGFLRVVGRVLNWLVRARVLRPMLGLAVLLWLLDGAISMATDAAWFSSLGFGFLWRARLMWTMGLGAAFVVVGLGCAVPVLRAVARPAAPEMQEPSLPRALAHWQPLRARATRWGWAVIVVAALILGRDLGGHWSEFALAVAPEGGGSIAGFWMMRAPALASLLEAAWKFALVLSAVALGAGLLRALPFLAARPSITPRRWLSALIGLGAALYILRALGFGFEATRHAQIVDETEFARAIFVLLNGTGALGCLCMLVLLRRPQMRLLWIVAAILVLPSLGGDLLSPVSHRKSEAPPIPSDFEVSNEPPDDWPAWDEATLLRAARAHLMRDQSKRIIEWLDAGLSPARSGRGTRADLVGAPVVSDGWAGHGLADREGDFVWNSLDLPEQKSSREGQPIGPLFYGLNARPLLYNGDIPGARTAGVALDNWVGKLAWSWSLRDPLLLFDSARWKRLLVTRGARETGQKLAPFWTWDEPVPRRDKRTGSAYFECVAYSSSAAFPRRAAFESGLFAGQNAVFPVAVLRVDARSGALKIAPFAQSNFVAARWKSALPSLFSPVSAQEVPTPALENALAGETPLVWTHSKTGWRKRAIPLALRLPIEEKLAAFASSRAPSSSVGATPVLWREGKTLFLAQAFFALPAVTQNVPIERDAVLLPPITSVVAGPLGKPLVRSGSSLAEVRVALRSSAPQVQPSSATALPGATPVPNSGAQSLHSLSQQALEASNAASKALKTGDYSEWQHQNARANDLLKEIARRTR